MWVNASKSSPTHQCQHISETGQRYYIVCDDRAIDVFTHIKDTNTIQCFDTVVCCQTFDVLNIQTMQEYVDAMFQGYPWNLTEGE